MQLYWLLPTHSLLTPISKAISLKIYHLKVFLGDSYFFCFVFSVTFIYVWLQSRQSTKLRIGDDTELSSCIYSRLSSPWMKRSVLSTTFSLFLYVILLEFPKATFHKSILSWWGIHQAVTFVSMQTQKSNWRRQVWARHGKRDKYAERKLWAKQQVPWRRGELEERCI